MIISNNNITMVIIKPDNNYHNDNCNNWRLAPCQIKLMNVERLSHSSAISIDILFKDNWKKFFKNTNTNWHKVYREFISPEPKCQWYTRLVRFWPVKLDYKNYDSAIYDFCSMCKRRSMSLLKCTWTCVRTIAPLLSAAQLTLWDVSKQTLSRICIIIITLDIYGLGDVLSNLK